MRTLREIKQSRDCFVSSPLHIAESTNEIENTQNEPHERRVHHTPLLHKLSSFYSGVCEHLSSLDCTPDLLFVSPLKAKNLKLHAFKPSIQ